MIASPPQQLKTCGKCFRLLPVESFRFSKKAAGLRHTVCGDCRRQNDQDRRRNHRQQVLCRGLYHMSRVNTTESMWNIAMNLCTSMGSLGTVLETFREMILDKETTPPSRRRTGTKTLLHIVAVADKERMRLRQNADQVQLRQLASAHLEQLRRLADQEQSPEEFIRRLHVGGELVPIIRVMLDDGTLTLDDIDPPPCEAWE